MLLGTQEETEREIPHETGQSMTFRPLPGRALRRAREIVTERFMSQVGMDGMRQAAQIAADSSGDGGEEEDQGVGLDMDTVLEAGIVSWSYETPVNPQSLALLDDVTEEWAFNEIVALSLRPRAEGNGLNSSS